MKTLYPISHESALQFWRSSKSWKHLKKLSINERKLSRVPEKYLCSVTNDSAIYIHDELRLEYPIVFMVAERKSFIYSSRIKTVLRPQNLTQSSFSNINENIIIATPEYCFLTLAKNTPFEELVEIANNLCSRYLIDENKEYGQCTMDEHVCNTTLIRKYLTGVKNYKGLKKAILAVKYAVDNSNSPMESKLAVIICIPKVRGGYGLPKMKMNYYIKLSEEGAKLVGCEWLMVDMVWLNEKVIVEYDSDEAHLDSNQHSFDMARINALNQSGYRVITITKKDLRSVRNLDAVMEVLRMALHLRNNKKELEKYIDRRRNVMINLFYKKKNSER